MKPEEKTQEEQTFLDEVIEWYRRHIEWLKHPLKKNGGKKS